MERIIPLTDATATPATCEECGAVFRVASPERTYTCRGCGGEVKVSAEWASMLREHAPGADFEFPEIKRIERRVGRAAVALKVVAVVGFIQLSITLDAVERVEEAFLERLETPELPLPLLVESALTYLTAGGSWIVAARFRHNPAGASQFALALGLGSLVAALAGVASAGTRDSALQVFRVIFALLLFSSCFRLALDHKRILTLMRARIANRPPPGFLARIAMFFGGCIILVSIMTAFRVDMGDGEVDVLRGIDAYSVSGDPAEFVEFPDNAFRIREALEEARSQGAWGGPGASVRPGYLGSLRVRKTSGGMDCRWTAEDGTLTTLQLSESGGRWSVDRCFVRLAGERRPAHPR